MPPPACSSSGSRVSSEGRITSTGDAKEQLPQEGAGREEAKGEEQEEAKLLKLKSHNPKQNIAWELTTPTQPAPKKESRGREERHGGRSRVAEDRGWGEKGWGIGQRQGESSQGRRKGETERQREGKARVRCGSCRWRQEQQRRRDGAGQGAWGRQVPENIALYISHSTHKLTRDRRGGREGWEEVTLRRGSSQRELLTPRARKAGGTSLSPPPHSASVGSKQGHAQGVGVGFTEGWSSGGGGGGEGQEAGLQGSSVPGLLELTP